MLGHLTRYITLSFLIALSLTGYSQTVADSLRNTLANADDLNDSIVTLYRICDNSPHSLQGKTLEEIYQLAMRRKDYPTVYNVLKQTSDYYENNDSIPHKLIARAEELPDSPEKQSTLVYLNVKASSNLLRHLTDTQRKDKLREYLTQHKISEEFETYKRIEYLLQLCKYLSISTEGVMLTNYLQELQTLIDGLPPHDLMLKYLFYKQAASSYLSNSMINESVEANKELLKIIDKLEKQDAALRRSSGHYNKTAFLCYKHLLRCHQSLTQDEIEDYYSKIKSLIESNPNLQGRLEQAKKPTIYYLMAKKRYAEAIPLIRQQLNDPLVEHDDQLYLAGALLKAAESVGDKDAILDALEMSNDMLKARIKNKATESYKELQLIYEVNDLKQSNDELVLTNQQIMIKRHKDLLTYATICLILLVIFLVIVFVLYRHSKHLTSNLTKTNALITDERDALQRTKIDLIKARNKVKTANRMKNDFINNIGHEIRTPLESIVEYSGLIADCAAPDRRENIKQFADIITLNTDLLLTLVNDVLELPSLENAKFGIHLTESSVQEICYTAIDKAKDHVNPHINIIFDNEGQSDTYITTDPQRVEQVLLSLLLNASRFTDKESITLHYDLSPQNDKMTFTITEAGASRSESNGNIISPRSENAGDTTQDNSLGLYISRLIVGMLGGSLKLDFDSRIGAKFIFTIPVS